MKIFIFLLAAFTYVSATDIACLVGGNEACQVSCMTSTGSLDGRCDENDNCLCGPTPKQTVATDNVCTAGCNVQCINEGHLYGGECDTNNTCVCDETEGRTVSPKKELLCLLGGHFACRISCLVRMRQNGQCSQNQCICRNPNQPQFGEEVVLTSDARTLSTNTKRSLACRLGGNTVCSAYCFWTTGRKEGLCDALHTCHCPLN